ncbi:hypothetical protein [Microlunatus sp. Y2014]|uniref:hypothetical protein n=1 Tax=Microlunatus sp. Y2014 TaxID=3418488 RepID=UPI003DA71752
MTRKITASNTADGTIFPHPYLTSVAVDHDEFARICRDYPDREAWDHTEAHPYAGHTPGRGKQGALCARNGCSNTATWNPIGVRICAYYCPECASSLFWAMVDHFAALGQARN